MDLLEQEYNDNNNNSKTPKKKIVLIALMISIILLVLVLVVLSSLPKNTTPTKEVLIVNGEEKEKPKNIILTDETGENRYISIKKLVELIGYQYYNGEYGKTVEDKNKCYVNNSNYIVGFENDSDKIYKTQVDSVVDYQNYKIGNKIVSYENELYININDVAKSLNIIISYDEDKNQTSIQTPSYIISQIQKKYDDNKVAIKIDTEITNQNAIVYDYLIVVENKKYGVLSQKDTTQTIIGTKYNSLEFDEYTNTFIVSTNNGYGIIDSDGNKIIELKYEDIDIVNYSPLLYKVKENNKYGIIDKNGKIIVSIDYDEIGYTENKKANTNSVMVIKNLEDNKNGIVVEKDGKYGLISISNGDTIFECQLDAIYSKTTDEGTIDYFVLYDGKEYQLQVYINDENTTTVDIS